MLDSIDSYEISEWIAFERAFGPLGSGYNDRALAAIHAQITLLCGLIGKGNWGDDFDVDNLPSTIPLPDEMYVMSVFDDEEGD